MSIICNSVADVIKTYFERNDMKQLILHILILFLYFIVGCSESQSIDEGTSEINNYTIEVHIDNNKTGEIAMDKIKDGIVEITQVDSAIKAISLSDIISRVNEVPSDVLNAYLSQYKCDFQSIDGFKSSSKGERCAPLDCTVTFHGYIDIDSKNLFFTNDSGVTEGCYHVKNFNTILMYKK